MRSHFDSTPRSIPDPLYPKNMMSRILLCIVRHVHGLIFHTYIGAPKAFAAVGGTVFPSVGNENNMMG